MNLTPVTITRGTVLCAPVSDIAIASGGLADCIVCRYGLGLVKMRQGQHKSATLHFVNAGKINPRSSVLKCYIGMVRLFV